MSYIFADVPSGFVGPSGFYGPAIPNGQPSVSVPLSSVGNYARVWVQPYLVHSGADVPGATGAPGIYPNTYLVEESARQPVGGGFVSFSRSFAEIPSGFNDFKSMVYSFIPLNAYRTYPRVKPVVSRVWNDFFLTNSPESLTLSGAQRYTINGWDTTVLTTGSSPNIATYSAWVASGVEFIPEDASLERYMGALWMRSTPYIKAQ